MCSINWTKSRGHILFYKILSKRSPWALKDEEPCLFYCKDTPNSLGGMRLFKKRTLPTHKIRKKTLFFIFFKYFRFKARTGLRDDFSHFPSCNLKITNMIDSKKTMCTLVLIITNLEHWPGWFYLTLIFPVGELCT